MNQLPYSLEEYAVNHTVKRNLISFHLWAFLPLNPKEFIRKERGKEFFE